MTESYTEELPDEGKRKMPPFSSTYTCPKAAADKKLEPLFLFLPKWMMA